MPFDEEELDPHGECRAEIERLRALLISCRKAMEESQRVGGATDWQHMIAAINGANGE